MIDYWAQRARVAEGDRDDLEQEVDLLRKRVADLEAGRKKVFLVEREGCGTHHYIVRANDASHAENIAKAHAFGGRVLDENLEGGLLVIDPDGPAGVLWAHENSSDTGDRD